MTLACPQCNSPVAREGQRFCYRCGNDLRSYYDSRGVKLDDAQSQPTPAEPAEPVASVAPEEKADGTGDPPQQPAVATGANDTDAHSAKDTSGIAPAVKTVVMSSLDSTADPVRAEVKPEQKAMLRILLPSGDVFDREISHTETQMGKGPRNDIVISDPAVSTSHAVIRAEKGGYSIIDLGSRNGTFVNSERISEPRRLHHGDVVGIGLTKLTFRSNDQSETGSIQRTEVMKIPVHIGPPPLTEDSLAEALVSEGLLAKAEVERLRGADSKGRRLYRALIEERAVSEESLRDLMSRIFQISVIDLRATQVDEAASPKFPARLARSHIIFPVKREADQIVLAVADPTDRDAVKEAERESRGSVSMRLATATEIIEQIDRRYAAKLIGVLPSGEKLQYPIIKKEVEIGKAQHNHIVLTDPTVSNTHAIILFREGGYSIVDLGSRNGTFVNGERLGTHSHTLRHGDSIQLGQTVLTFRNPAETNENVTATLSPEALAEIRKRAGIPDATGEPTLPKEKPKSTVEAAASAAGAGVQATPEITQLVDDGDKEEKKKKKKEKDKDKKDERLKAAYVGALSRILAQVIAVLLSVGLALFIAQRSMSPSKVESPANAISGGAERSKFTNPGPATAFRGGTFEASGVVHIPNSDGVLFVDDSKGGEVFWMQVDQSGKQVGNIKSIPLGVSVANPESITYGGNYVYVASSMGDPKDGDRNAIVRFSFDPSTQTVQGQPEVIPNVRDFLLNNVPEIKSEGEKPGVKGGLNIEGMAWDPVNAHLLIGLRSPLVLGQAVIVPLKFNDPNKFSIESLAIADPKVIPLPLGGFGVRDVQYDPQSRSFWIIAGALDTARKTDFRVFEWNGDALQPKVREDMTIDEDIKPEGITRVRLGSTSYVLIVGDANNYFRVDDKS